MYSGLMTALITPFTKSGKVDYKALQRIVEYQIDNKTDVLVPCGTTGESPTLSHEEHDAVIEKTIEYSNGRAKVMAGTGSNSTEEAIRLTKHAEESGADAALVVAPYYNKPTQEGLYEYFSAVAKSVKIPIIVYNIPGRTGVNVSVDTLTHLAKTHENIAGVKEATGSLTQISLSVAEAGKKAKCKDFSVLSGDDALTLPLMSVGGKGVVSVIANLFPAEMKSMVDFATEGDFKQALTIHNKLLPLMTGMLSLETNPGPIKYAMYKAGFSQTAALRSPMVEVSAQTAKKLDSLLKKFGIK